MGRMARWEFISMKDGVDSRVACGGNIWGRALPFG